MTRLLAALVAALVAMPAWAQSQQPSCGRASDAFAALAQKYGEQPAFAGSIPEGAIVVTVNPSTRTWTILIQPSPEVACLVTSGEHWTEAVTKPDTKKEPGI